VLLSGGCHTSAGTADAACRSAASVTNPTDERSPMATAYQWVSRITVVALEMVLPGLAGYWLDQRIGTGVLFMLIGFGLGFTAATVHLVQIARFNSGSKLND
jgi:F0F1-type ATP synthase assembly protein I